MKMSNYAALIGVIMLAGTMSFAATTGAKTVKPAPVAAVKLVKKAAVPEVERANIGIAWGVGFGTVYNDKRLTSISQIVDLDFKIDKTISLRVSFEDMQISGEDGNERTDGSASLTGMGVVIQKTLGKKLGVSIGLSLGREDVDLPVSASGTQAIAETIPYGQIELGIGLTRETNVLDAGIMLELVSRYAQVNNADVFGNANDPVQDMSQLVQLNLKIQVMF